MAAVTAAAIGGAAALGTGVAGAVAANNASKRAARTAGKAADNFYRFDDPDYEAMLLNLEELKSQGLITPEMEQEILQDPTLLADVNQDPRLLQAEMDALDTLSRISNQGGMDAQARLGMEQALLQSRGEARSAREANMLDAAQRGRLGGGLEFVSNQMADQNAANSAQMAGLAEAAAANQRDLAALDQMTGLSNQMQTRGMNLDLAKAQAQDAINRFNTQTRADVNQRNVQNRNQAQVANLAERQRIADENVKLRNAQQQYNRSIEQQKFDNNLARAQGAAGVAGAQSQAQAAAGQGVANILGGLGQSALGAGASIFANQNKDISANQKKDDKE